MSKLGVLKTAGLAPLLLLFAATVALSTTYNSPVVDDGVPPSPDGSGDTSWVADEFLFDDRGDNDLVPWGPNNLLDGLWVTWDADGVYFSVTGALWDTPSGVGANAVNLYIDADFGEGTGPSDMGEIDSEALGAISRNFSRTFTVEGGFGVDWGFTCWSGRFDLGFLDVRDPAAPVNLFDGVSDASSVNTHTSPEGVIESRDLAGNSGYELFVPWAVLYPDVTAGEVPPGTQIACVVAQVGGGDSLSPESMPDEAGDRVIGGSISFVVDADGDGVPDVDWPPSGSIAGTVTLDDPQDITTRITVLGLLDGVEAARAITPPGGGDYLLPRLGPGSYEVVLESNVYFADPIPVTLADGEDRTGVDILAERINSGVDFSVAFVEGPQATSRTVDVVYQLLTTESPPRSVAEGSITPEDPLSLRLSPVRPGDYRLVLGTSSADPLVADRTGYDPVALELTVVEDQFLDLGQIDLRLVQPTRIVYTVVRAVDDPLDPVRATRVSASLPGELFFARRNLMVTLIDADGDEALLGLSERNQVRFSITDYDPRFPAAGNVDYWDFEDDLTPVAAAGDRPNLDVLDPDEIVPTRAFFRISSDTRQVLRLRATHPTIGIHDLEVKITPRLPTSIRLTADAMTAVAGEEVPVRAQLLDVSGDDSQTSDVVIRFEFLGEYGGAASFSPSEVISRSDGSVGTEGNLTFRSELAGEIRFRALGIVQQDTIRSEEVIIDVDPASPRRLAVEAQQATAERVDGVVRLADAFGNTILNDPRNVVLATQPADLVVEAPGTLSLDEDGRASFEITVAEGRSGILLISATEGSLPIPTTSLPLELRPGLAASDEAAPETDDAHNSLAEMDLTTLFATVVDDTLAVTLPFSTNFVGVHVALLLELEGDAEGAFSDPFTFPISYDHPLLPDYVLTYKYSADDYGDLRRQAGPPGSWEWFNFATQTWATGFEEGVNAKAQGMMGKTVDEVFFRIPIRELKPDFVAGTDTVRVQAYLMQEEGDEKRPAFDSVPHDDTADLADPTIPDFEWWENLPPSTTLRNLTPFVPREIGSSLRLGETAFLPDVSTQGETILLTAAPLFQGAAPPNASLQVFADLSANFGGDALTPMADDGTRGDVTAGDGIYTTEVTIPSSLLEGDYSVVLRALEVTTSQQAFGRATVVVEGEPELTPILVAEDPLGDDHGPNRRGEQYLFYQYPTSGVFFDGVFDLRRLEVFDVGDRLLFRVRIADLTNPAQEGAADWNATYPSDETCPTGSRVDLNLQNIVILLDTEQGNGVGSTNLPDNRRAGVAGQDAWEYALVYDGWWKGVVRSNGESDQGAWETFQNDSDWFFCANDETNTIDGFLDKDLLAPGALAEIESWDIMVLLSGHDGDSNNDNWGGVRWVNEGVEEWIFGGGRNGEGTSDRDPNVIDLMTLAGLAPTGEPRPSGLSQEEQMNFFTLAARERFAEGKDAVLFEATGFIDEVPPSVQWMGLTPDRAVIPWQVLKDSPVVVRANLVDEAGVAEATLYWRSPGESPTEARPVAMGQIRSGLEENGSQWVADLRWDDVVAATDSGPLEDPTDVASERRFIYVSIDAVDKVGNATTTGGERVEELLELPLETVEEIRYEDLVARASGDALDVDLNEGSRLRLPTALAQSLAPDSTSVELQLRLRAIAAEDLDLSFTGSRSESILQGNDRYLGIARDLELFTVDGTDTLSVGELDEPVQLSLHFPSYLVDEARPWELQFFRWNERTRRWILVGAHGERSGSTITALVDRLGTYAAFVRPEDIDTDKVVTGVQLSPNPFSPNGDGLYDELNITYVLPDDTESVIVEVFDKRGERLRTLQFFASEGVTGRTLGLSWDGRDDSGRDVPRGIYIVRVEAVDSQDNRVERATEAVAVIR